MSSLFVYHATCPDLPQKVLNHLPDIAATLAEQGVTFTRLPVGVPIRPGADAQSVIAALQVQIDTLKAAAPEALLQVISVDRDHPQKTELRQQGLQEQFCEGDEVRFFASGRGLLSLHLGDYVYALSGERDDVVSMPAGTRHWFDLGEQPHLVVIRLCSPTGHVAKVTGDDIASRFAGLDD